MIKYWNICRKTSKKLVILLSILLFPAFLSHAEYSLQLPSTITVEMYQLHSNGAKTQFLCSSNNNNEKEYGCTAIVDDNNFVYPYNNSTPTVNLEDYILDVVSKEMNPNIWIEAIALQTQAIASRSYAGWHENNKDDLPAPFNNSNQFQVFVPFAFEWLTTADGNTPHQSQTCADTNLSVGQQRVCVAVIDKFYIAQAANNSNNYPAKAMFLQDMYAETDDGTFDKPYLAGVQDPISVACDAQDIVPEPTPSIGMSQRGANRWARGHQCSYQNAPIASGNDTGTDWRVHWDEAAQILTHYYTGIHLRDAANSNQQLTPDYRWNLLDVSWAETGCPDVIPENGVCAGTFLIQNTGTTAWNTGHIFFDHYTLSEQANRSTNALFHPVGINTTASPGKVVTVTTSISPPAGAIVGSQHTIRFDMAYAENDTVNYFSEREAGRPWYTYDLESCVGYCRQSVYLPLVMKNWPWSFTETFYPARNSGWILSGATPSPNGRTDAGALYFEETASAQISINVPANDELSISFWCKDTMDDYSYPRIDLYLDGEDVTPGYPANNILCYKIWTYHEYMIDNNANDSDKYGDTSDGQVVIKFRGSGDTGGLGSVTKILVDDIVIEQ